MCKAEILSIDTSCRAVGAHVLCHSCVHLSELNASQVRRKPGLAKSASVEENQDMVEAMMRWVRRVGRCCCGKLPGCQAPAKGRIGRPHLVVCMRCWRNIADDKDFAPPHRYSLVSCFLEAHGEFSSKTGHRQAQHPLPSIAGVPAVDCCSSLPPPYSFPLPLAPSGND